MTEIEVPLSLPDLDEREIAAATRVLRRRWLTMGEETLAFEAEFAAAVGVPQAVAVSNCTVGLHLALLALGVRPGDEVLVPSLSFVASANAICYCGATPVLAEVTSEADLNLSPADAAARITPRTRGIVAVHYGGYPADMGRLATLARDRGLFLLEDAAQAAGAARDGRACGAWGDAACFSFYSTKNMTTGEGGILTTADAEVAERARLLRSHAMTATVLERDRGERFGYDVVDLGYNYRIDEMRAAIGRVQLEKLAVNNERRRRLTETYRSRLAAAPGVEVPFAGLPGTSSHHLMPVLLPPGTRRDRVAESMRARGIQTSVHYHPIHLMRYYRERYASQTGMLPLTERVAERELTLPLYASMGEAAVEKVTEALRQSLDG